MIKTIIKICLVSMLVMFTLAFCGSLLQVLIETKFFTK